MGSQMVMFGGQSLEDNADLNDLFFLTKVRAPACSQHCCQGAEALTRLWGHRHLGLHLCSMVQMSACNGHYKSTLFYIQHMPMHNMTLRYRGRQAYL